MADLDDDAIVVTLPADGDGTVITKIEGEQKTPVKDETDPIADLKGQFATMTQRATAAETAHQQTAHQLEEARRELQTTKTEVVSSQLDTVLSGIQAANAEADAAEKDYIAAFEAGDGPAQARAQRKMAAAEARVQRLNEAKGDLEEAKATKPVQRTEARPEPRQEPTDKVELFAKSMSPRSAAWIRAHPDCVTDSKKNFRMLAAHNLAVADDIPIDSDEYFQRIEAGVADKAVKIEPKPEVKVDATGKRPISAAASGANSGGGMNGGGMEVRLSAREVAAANDGSIVHNFDDPNGKFKKGDPVGTVEFARRKSIMQKQGLYDRGFIES
jgi:chemotaxis protein histidine kinase CheA